MIHQAISNARASWERRLVADFASFNPSTDVPNLLAWYRADTTTNSGGFVSALNDKKGSKNYTQATGSKQPAFISAGSDPNGRACVVFDGVDDALTLASPGHGALTDITIFGVVRSIVAVNPVGRMWSHGNSNIAGSLLIFPNTSQSEPLVAYYNPLSVSSVRGLENAPASTSFYAASTPRVFSARHSAALTASTTPVTRSRLGTPRTANSVSSSTPAALGVLGCAFGGTPSGLGNTLSWGLYEWLICDAFLTDDQCRLVECYLQGYHNNGSL